MRIKRLPIVCMNIATIMIMLLSIPAIIFAFALWTDRSMDYVLTAVAGHAVDCPMWLSTVITLILNGAIILLNTIVEVVRLVR